MKNYKGKIIQLTLWLAFLTTFISGQTQKENELVRAGNHVVSEATAIDAKREKSIGKTSKLERFGLDVPVRCPLTLILYCNFASGSALRCLTQSKVRKSLKENSANAIEKHKIALIIR